MYAVRHPDEGHPSAYHGAHTPPGHYHPNWFPSYHEYVHYPVYPPAPVLAHPPLAARERVVVRTVPVLKWRPGHDNNIFVRDDEPVSPRGHREDDRCACCCSKRECDCDSAHSKNTEVEKRASSRPRNTTKKGKRASVVKKAKKRGEEPSQSEENRRNLGPRPPLENYEDEPISKSQESRCCCRYGSCEDGCAKQGCLRPYDSYIAANWQKGSWMARYRSHANSLKAFDYLTDRLPKLSLKTLEDFARVASGVQETIDDRPQGVVRQIDVDIRNEQQEESRGRSKQSGSGKKRSTSASGVRGR